MTDPVEITHRVRAALAYGETPAWQLAEALDVPPKRVSRWLRLGEPDPHQWTRDELAWVARLTGVPARWLGGGAWRPGLRARLAAGVRPRREGP